jgi:hypothetical protein
MRQAAAWTASNLGHPPFEWSVSLSRRKDGIRGTDHSINPCDSRDAEQHTSEHVAHLVWLYKKVSLT